MPTRYHHHQPPHQKKRIEVVGRRGEKLLSLLLAKPDCSLWGKSERE